LRGLGSRDLKSLATVERHPDEKGLKGSRGKSSRVKRGEGDFRFEKSELRIA